MRTSLFACAEIPGGESYHRLARTPRFRWWVPPLALLVFAVLLFFLWVGVLVVMTIVAILGGSGLAPDSVRVGEIAGLAFGLAAIALLAPVTLFVARVVQWRRPGSLLSVTGRVRWGWLARCVCAGAIPATAVAALVLVVSGEGPSDLPVTVGYGSVEVLAAALLVIALLVPLQSVAEEMTLRGMVMQLVGSLGSPTGRSAFSRVLRSPWPAILAGGTLFAALYAATHPGDAWNTAALAVLGLGMAWATWRTGGLEAAIGLHVVNSLIQFGVCAVEGRLDEVGSGVVLGGGLPLGTNTPMTLVLAVVQVGLYLLLVSALARRHGVARRSAPVPA
ncbi:CPBP family intramembrane glutamic endopeptidase [Nocardiopsis sp. NPDC006938]|uniref:CPBP family intramembrane glutamic endopeptidase n=1 Tax=Nocardiopsis sp. NPDC006938 TaxID=3364337 RepID=UPI0036C72920